MPRSSFQGPGMIPIVHDGQTVALSVRALGLATSSDIPCSRAGKHCRRHQWNNHRLQAVGSLRKSQAKLTASVRYANRLPRVIDESSRIVATNPLCRRFGYTAEELTGQPFTVLHPRMPQKAEEIIADMFEGETHTCSLPFISKDGDIIPVETKITRGIGIRKHDFRYAPT